MSYRRAHRSSWCLGYDSALTSSTTLSSGLGRHSYGSSIGPSTPSSSSYGLGSSSSISSSRLDYSRSSLGSDTSIGSRSSLYTPSYRSSSGYSSSSSGIGTVSSYGDTRIRRSSYGSYSNDTGTSSARAGLSSSTSTESVDTYRDSSSSYNRVRRRRSDDNESSHGSETPRSRKLGIDHSGTSKESHVDTVNKDSEISTTKEATHSIASEVVTNDSEISTSLARRRSGHYGRSCRPASFIEKIEEHESKSAVTDTKNDNSDSNKTTLSDFDQKLASYVKDCDAKTAASTESLRTSKDTSSVDKSSKTIDSSSTLGAVENDKAGKKVDDDNEDDEEEVFHEEIIEITQIPLNLSTSVSRGSDLNEIKKPDQGHPSSRLSTKEEGLNATVEDTKPSGLISAEDLSKRSIKANGTVRGNGVVPSSTTSTPNHKASPGTGGSTTTNTSQKEIHRLESLCEARTKELTQTKMQLKATAQAFDAMSVVVNYCCAELNAFECPQLAQKLDTVQKQLTDCLSQIAELTSQKETLDQSLTQITQEKAAATLQAEEAATKAETEREDHQRVQKELEDTHNAALTTQRDELTSKHTEVVKKLHERHDREIELQKQSFDRQILDVQNEHKMEINGIRISHLEEIQELRNKHDKQMEELHKQHRNKLEDITHRFESIKVTLSEKVESLRGECDDLRHRARSSEDALQRDADVKVQMALAPYLALPKEIESLRTVVEMRNEEIQRLRSKNMDLEKQLEEIPIAREKIISLQQKVENLEAIINIKTDHEKQLHEKCQVLMKKYDRESRANKRLSMDYEQVMWRMSQSQEFGSSESLSKRQVSRSPPRSETNSPDPRRRALSPNDPMSMSGEVVMRAKKRSSHSASEGERKLRSRSATFVVEKNGGTIGDAASESRSPSASPLPKPKRWKRPLSQPNGGSGNGGDEESSEQSSDNLDAGKNGEDRMVQSDYSNNANDELLNETFDSQPEMLSSTGEMIHSYARSISAVSDSGVYDSLTRSEMLNSSIISTDSEWAVASTTSANVSLNFDLTADDLNAIHESKGENTVLDTSTATTTPTAETSTAESVTICVESGSPSKENASVKVTGNVPENFVSEETQNTYQFQVSLPSGDGDTSLDNVFEEDEEREHEEVSLDSCTFSMEYTDGASASNSRLTSVSEDSNLQDDKEEVLDGESVNKSNTE